MKYEWDLKKAEANFAKHGVRFVEAVTVLEDDYALTRDDPDSFNEQRLALVQFNIIQHYKIY